MINFFKRNFSFVIFYFGIFLILFGGFVTFLFGEEGFIEIKEGQSVNGYWLEDDIFHPLDFSLLLRDFSVELYPEKIKGMRFVKSYKSLVTITQNGNLMKKEAIEVNKPLSFRGFSFYQYGYDESLPNQTVLQIVKDPGLGFVYTGYLILVSGLLLSFKKIWKI